MTTVSPAELRVWLQGRRPNLFQGKYNDMTREVIRRHQIKALGDASAVKRDADGRELKADEQREFNRHLATAGEIAAIENELAAAERMNSHAAEALAAENRRPGESKGGVIFPHSPNTSHSRSAAARRRSFGSGGELEPILRTAVSAVCLHVGGPRTMTVDTRRRCCRKLAQA